MRASQTRATRDHRRSSSASATQSFEEVTTLDANSGTCACRDCQYASAAHRSRRGADRRGHCTPAAASSSRRGRASGRHSQRARGHLQPRSFASALNEAEERCVTLTRGEYKLGKLNIAEVLDLPVDEAQLLWLR